MAGTFIYQELPPKQRIIALSKICIRKEEFAFTVSLTEEELNAEKDRFARAHMRKDQLKDELKLENDRIKAEIKKIDAEAEKTLEIITMEQRKRSEEVFLIPDHTTNVMTYVTKAGEVVHTREMQADEKQGRLFNGEEQERDLIVESINKEEGEVIAGTEDETTDNPADEFATEEERDAWENTWNDHITAQLYNLDEETAEIAGERLDYLKTCRFEIVGDGQTYQYANGNQLTWGDVRDLNADEWDFTLADVMGPQEDPAEEEHKEKAEMIMGRIDQLKELGYEVDESGYRKGDHLITNAGVQEATAEEWYELIGIDPKTEEVAEQEPITAFYNPAAVEENPPAKKTRKKKATDEKPSNNN